MSFTEILKSNNIVYDKNKRLIKLQSFLNNNNITKNSTTYAYTNKLIKNDKTNIDKDYWISYDCMMDVLKASKKNTAKNLYEQLIEHYNKDNNEDLTDNDTNFTNPTELPKLTGNISMISCKEFLKSSKKRIKCVVVDCTRVYYKSKDVCDVLGFSNASSVTKKYVDDTDKVTVDELNKTLHKSGLPSIDNDKPKTLYIDDSGFSKLALKGKLKKGKDLLRWIMMDVVPHLQRCFAKSKVVDDVDTVKSKDVVVEEKQRTSKNKEYVQTGEPDEESDNRIAEFLKSKDIEFEREHRLVELMSFLKKSRISMNPDKYMFDNKLISSNNTTYRGKKWITYGCMLAIYNHSSKKFTKKLCKTVLKGLYGCYPLDTDIRDNVVVLKDNEDSFLQNRLHGFNTTMALPKIINGISIVDCKDFAGSDSEYTFVRAVLFNNDVYFRATNLCKIFGIANIYAMRKFVSDNVEYERKVNCRKINDTRIFDGQCSLNDISGMLYISSDGVRELCQNSSYEKAVEMQQWLVDTVTPHLLSFKMDTMNIKASWFDDATLDVMHNNFMRLCKTLDATEKYLPIPGFCKRYYASTIGRIYDALQDSILDDDKDKWGYRSVKLEIDAIKEDVQVHRLVAETLLIPSTHREQTVVDHIDRNKDNNTVSNLRWLTAGQNSMNQVRSKKKYPGTFLNNGGHFGKFIYKGREIVVGPLRTKEDAYNECNRVKEIYFRKYVLDD